MDTVGDDIRGDQRLLKQLDQEAVIGLEGSRAGRNHADDVLAAEVELARDDLVVILGGRLLKQDDAAVEELEVEIPVGVDEGRRGPQRAGDEDLHREAVARGQGRLLLEAHPKAIHQARGGRRSPDRVVVGLKEVISAGALEARPRLQIAGEALGTLVVVEAGLGADALIAGLPSEAIRVAPAGAGEDAVEAQLAVPALAVLSTARGAEGPKVIHDADPAGVAVLIDPTARAFKAQARQRAAHLAFEAAVGLRPASRPTEALLGQLVEGAELGLGAFGVVLTGRDRADALQLTLDEDRRANLTGIALRVIAAAQPAVVDVRVAELVIGALVVLPAPLHALAPLQIADRPDGAAVFATSLNALRPARVAELGITAVRVRAAGRADAGVALGVADQLELVVLAVEVRAAARDAGRPVSIAEEAGEAVVVLLATLKALARAQVAELPQEAALGAAAVGAARGPLVAVAELEAGAVDVADAGQPLAGPRQAVAEEAEVAAAALVVVDASSLAQAADLVADLAGFALIVGAAGRAAGAAVADLAGGAVLVEAAGADSVDRVAGPSLPALAVLPAARHAGVDDPVVFADAPQAAVAVLCAGRADALAQLDVAGEALAAAVRRAAAAERTLPALEVDVEAAELVKLAIDVGLAAGRDAELAIALIDPHLIADLIDVALLVAAATFKADLIVQIAVGAWIAAGVFEAALAAEPRPDVAEGASGAEAHPAALATLGRLAREVTELRLLTVVVVGAADARAGSRAEVALLAWAAILVAEALRNAEAAVGLADLAQIAVRRASAWVAAQAVVTDLSAGALGRDIAGALERALVAGLVRRALAVVEAGRAAEGLPVDLDAALPLLALAVVGAGAFGALPRDGVAKLLALAGVRIRPTAELTDVAPEALVLAAELLGEAVLVAVADGPDAAEAHALLDLDQIADLVHEARLAAPTPRHATCLGIAVVVRLAVGVKDAAADALPAPDVAELALGAVQAVGPASGATDRRVEVEVAELVLGALVVREAGRLGADQAVEIADLAFITLVVRDAAGDADAAVGLADLARGAVAVA